MTDFEFWQFTKHLEKFRGRHAMVVSTQPPEAPDRARTDSGNEPDFVPPPGWIG